MEWEDRIHMDPAILGGMPVIKGTRVPLKVILDSLAGGDSIEEVWEGYGLTREDMLAALAFAAEAVNYTRSLPNPRNS